jgi:hypothetical protein
LILRILPAIENGSWTREFDKRDERPLLCRRIMIREKVCEQLEVAHVDYTLCGPRFLCC